MKRRDALWTTSAVLWCGPALAEATGGSPKTPPARVAPDVIAATADCRSAGVSSGAGVAGLVRR